MILTEQNIQEIYKYILEKGGIKDSQFDIKQLDSIDKEYVYFPIIYDTPEEGIKYDNGRLLYKDVEKNILKNILEYSTKYLIKDKVYSNNSAAQFQSPFNFYIQTISNNPYYKISYGNKVPFYVAYGTDSNSTGGSFKKIIEFKEIDNSVNPEYEFSGELNVYGWNKKKNFLQNAEFDNVLNLNHQGISIQTNRNDTNFVSDLNVGYKNFYNDFAGLFIRLSTNDSRNTRAGVLIEGKTEKDILTAAGTTTQLKTINGQSILGEGNIQINTTSSNNIIIQ